MSVQVAAYGIDLSSASRVYFVSPVWQTAMEQQAIKRAHRIGQTKPVYVETIVIRSSIEENMLKRRAMLAVKAEKKQGKSPNLQYSLVPRRLIFLCFLCHKVLSTNKLQLHRRKNSSMIERCKTS